MRTLLRVDIEEDNADYTLVIDGKATPLYQIEKHSEQYGFSIVEIKVHQGRVKIPSKCTAIYNEKHFDQNDFIEWFYSPIYKLNTWYDSDIHFYHLYAQGPSYFIDDKPIWNYTPTLAGHLVERNTLTDAIKEMICQ